MNEDWRKEPLTRGDLHDILTKAADKIETRIDSAVKNLGPFGYGSPLRGVLGKAGPIMVDTLRETAKGLMT